MSKKIYFRLCAQQLFSKGFEISLLLLIPFLQIKLGFDFVWIGILTAVFAIAKIVSSFLSGDIARKIGNEYIMSLALIFNVFSFVSFIFSNNLIFLMLSTVLGGIAAGLFEAPSLSKTAKSAPQDRISTTLGNVTAYGDTGRIIFTLLTTFVVSKFDIFQIGIFGVIISLIALVITFEFRKVDLQKTKPVDYNLKKYLSNAKYRFAVLASMIDSFGGSSLYIFLTPFIASKGIQLETVGVIDTIYFVGYLSGRLLLTRLADKYGSIKVLIFAEIGMAIVATLVIFTYNPILISALLLLLGMFTRGTSPVLKGLIVRSVQDKLGIEKGFAISHSLNTTSTSISRLVFGVIGSTIGQAATIFTSAMISVLVIIPAIKYSKEKE